MSEVQGGVAGAAEWLQVLRLAGLVKGRWKEDAAAERGPTGESKLLLDRQGGSLRPGLGEDRDRR